jgi:hypothetical protein
LTQKKAYASALARGLSELEITVDQEMTSEEVAAGESYTETVVLKTKAKTAKVTIRGAKVHEACTTPSGKTTYVRAYIPGSEWSRLNRLARGETGALVVCSSDLEAACSASVTKRAEAAISEAGVRFKRVSATDFEGDLTPESLIQLGEKEGLVRLLVVSLTLNQLAPYKDAGGFEVKRVSGMANVGLYDVIDGKTVSEAQVGVMPGGGLGELIGHAYADDPPIAPYAESLQLVLEGQHDIEGLTTVLKRLQGDRGGQ